MLPLCNFRVQRGANKKHEMSINKKWKKYMKKNMIMCKNKIKWAPRFSKVH
jgi:hypothetical protein